MFSNLSIINKVFLILGSFGGVGVCFANCRTLIKDDIANVHYTDFEKFSTILLVGSCTGVLFDHLFPYHPFIIVLCSVIAGISSAFCRDNFLSTTLYPSGSSK